MIPIVQPPPVFSYTKMNVGFISLSIDSSNLFSCRSAGKESACNVRVLGSIPGLGRYSGEGKDYSLQYSGLENSMDCTVHGVTMNQTQLSDFHFTAFFMVQPLSLYMTTGKTIALTTQTCWQSDVFAF